MRDPGPTTTHSPAQAPTTAGDLGVATPRYRTYVLLLLLLVHIFSFLDRTLLGILAPEVKRDLAVSDTMLGLMNGLAFALLYVGVSLPMAFLADRFHRARILAGALAVWSLCTGLCGVTGTGLQLFAARMGVGIGEAGGTAPAHAIVTDYFPRAQRARALSIYSFGVPLGTTAGMLLGAYLSRLFDWHVAFLAIGGLGLPVALLFGLTVREPRHNSALAAEPPVSLAAAFSTVTSNTAFWYVSLGAGIAAMMGYGLVFWLPSFLIRSHGLTATQVALFYGSTTAVGGIAGNLIGGWGGDRLFRRRGASAYALVPATGFLLAAPFTVAAVLVGPVWAIFACLLVPAIASGAAQPTIISAVQYIATPRTRAVASALMMLVNTLIGLALGTALLGFLSDRMQARFGAESLRYAILSGTGLFLVAAALLVLAARALDLAVPGERVGPH